MRISVESDSLVLVSVIKNALTHNSCVGLMKVKPFSTRYSGSLLFMYNNQQTRLPVA